MMPSPVVGSGVEVRQTDTISHQEIANMGAARFLLSTFWKVNMPSRSNCVLMVCNVRISYYSLQIDLPVRRHREVEADSCPRPHWSTVRRRSTYSSIERHVTLVIDVLLRELHNLRAISKY